MLEEKVTLQDDQYIAFGIATWADAHKKQARFKFLPFKSWNEQIKQWPFFQQQK